MAKVHTWSFEVRTSDVNEYGLVSAKTCHNFLEEAATRASTANGYSYDWYMENGCMWVVRKITARYFRPMRYPESLVLRTWVSDGVRVRSHREYDLRRASDGRPVVRARCLWIYVNLATLRPQRIPADFDEAFEPSGPVDDLEDTYLLVDATPYADSRVFESRRKVQQFELDLALVVNNANYINWSDHALYEAVEQAGFDWERLVVDGKAFVTTAREIEYLRPARLAEDVRVVSRLLEANQTEMRWLHEMIHVESGDVLVQDKRVVSLIDVSTAVPQVFPAGMRDALATT